MSDVDASRYTGNVLGSDDAHGRQNQVPKADRQTGAAFKWFI